MSKEKPILFSTPMVQAILAGHKTMTRRVIKPQPMIMANGKPLNGYNDSMIKAAGEFPTPKYQPGDILWVRETWKPQNYQHIDGAWSCEVVFNAGGPSSRVHWQDGIEGIYERTGTWRPSIYMPREAARIFLRVKNVRVERVQGITHAGALAEGIPRCPGWKYELSECDCTVYAFAELWNSLNDKRGYGWDTNPWVWVYSFERVDKPTGWPGGEVEG